MASRRVHEAALHKLRRTGPGTLPLFKQLHEWIQSLESHHINDREATIIAFTFLEQSLEVLLKQHWKLIDSERSSKLFTSDGERDAALGSANARALMAECLGFISNKTFKDIQTVNLIRNTFAHSGHSISYSDPAIEALSHLNTMVEFGEEHEIRLQDNSILFRLNMTTARSRILSFILFFSLYCALSPDNEGGNPFKYVFT